MSESDVVQMYKSILSIISFPYILSFWYGIGRALTVRRRDRLKCMRWAMPCLIFHTTTVLAVL